MSSQSIASPTATRLRLMELADVPYAVDLHQRELPRGFFVDLGPRFLSAYYRSYLTSPAGLGLVATIDGEPAGFLVGTFDRAVHYRHVAKADRWRLATIGATALARRPALAARFARTRLGRYSAGVRRFATAEPAASVADRYHGVLSHVAVSPCHRRAGVGALLVAGFVDVARSSGTAAADVMTRGDNVRAQRMYESLGWQRVEDRTDVDGNTWVTYRRELS